MKTTKNLQPGIIVAAVLALLVGLWLGYYTGGQNPASNQPPQIQGTVLPTGKALTEFRLTDHHQQVFTQQQLTGHWSLMFVGYTHCPDVCPTTLTVLQHTARLMREQQLDLPQMVFVSIDPARDTPEILASYVSYFDKQILGVSGESTELNKLTTSLAVYYAKAAGSSGDINKDDYLMDHSAALMLINPQSQLQAYLNPPHSPEKIIESVIKAREYYENTKVND